MNVFNLYTPHARVCSYSGTTSIAWALASQDAHLAPLLGHNGHGAARDLQSGGADEAEDGARAEQLHKRVAADRDVQRRPVRAGEKMLPRCVAACCIAPTQVLQHVSLNFSRALLKRVIVCSHLTVLESLLL